MASYNPFDADYDPYATPNTSPNAAPVPTTPYRPPTTGSQEYNDLYSNVSGWYNQYLGRPGSHDELYGWTQNPYGVNAIQSGISGSPEAQAYASRTATPSTPPPTAPTAPAAGTPYGYMEGVDVNKLNDPSHQSEKYIASRILASGGSLQQAAAAIGATVLDATRMRLRSGEVIDTRRDEEGANALQWLVQGGGGPSGAAGMTGAPGTGAPGTGVAGMTGQGFAGGTSNVSANPNVFTDPATTEWERLLRQLVDRLNVPQPTWTDAQLELQQTQALDPLERQRQAQRQQMGQRLASRGITPGSGIFESAMADIDRQFNQLRTQTQGAFATRAIEREDQVFQGNEQRATNAVNTMRQIPQLADQRLAQAQGTIMQANPYGLLQLQQQIEQDRIRQSQYQDYQNQQFWAQIAQLLAQAL